MSLINMIYNSKPFFAVAELQSLFYLTNNCTSLDSKSSLVCLLVF